MRTLLVLACSGVGVAMLLPMHHHLERDPVQHVSTLETCPLDKFQSSLASMLENKLLPESNITNSAQTRYLELAEQDQCELGPAWYVSQKPLVVNVGEGTTATRWLNGIMKDLGFISKHQGLPFSLDSHGLHMNTSVHGFTGTSEVDRFDYISDTPTSSMTWQLLQSHPNALFLMTMRDPVEWRDTRLKHHPRPGDNLTWRQQGSPCFGDRIFSPGDTPLSARTYVAYSAWAKCVIPQDRFIGAVNVFTDEKNDAEFIEKLILALETHGLQKPDWKNRIARVRAKVASS